MWTRESTGRVRLAARLRHRGDHGWGKSFRLTLSSKQNKNARYMSWEQVFYRRGTVKRDRGTRRTGRESRGQEVAVAVTNGKG